MIKVRFICVYFCLVKGWRFYFINLFIQLCSRADGHVCDWTVHSSTTHFCTKSKSNDVDGTPQSSGSTNSIILPEASKQFVMSIQSNMLQKQQLIMSNVKANYNLYKHIWGKLLYEWYSVIKSESMEIQIQDVHIILRICYMYGVHICTMFLFKINQQITCITVI